MSQEKSRREVLLGSAAIAAALAAPGIAKSRAGGASARVYQGGTNPIVIGPKDSVQSGAGRTVSVTVYPGLKDSGSDVYNIRIIETSVVKKVTGLQIDIKQTGIEGIEGGEQYQYFQFPVTGSALGSKAITFRLDSSKETKVLTVCVYGPVDFTRSGTCTFELLKV
jgi:hypothetical protein